jgi:hypothetical protein
MATMIPHTLSPATQSRADAGLFPELHACRE